MVEVKNTVTEMKNAFDGLFISKLDTAEGRISVLEDISLETSKTKKEPENRLRKIEQNIQELWDNYKKCNICVMGISEGEVRKEGKEKIFETIMTENFPK